MITTERRRRGLKMLAARNGRSMTDELEAAIDAQLAAAGIQVDGDAREADRP